MSANVLKLSDILIEEFDLASYSQLKKCIKERALKGARFFEVDVKPPYPDTPVNWETELEIVFTSA
jgi:hypothetical protein